MERVCVGKLETVNIDRKEFRKICIEKGMDCKMMKEITEEAPLMVSLGISLAVVSVISAIEKELYGECNCEICRGGAVILRPERVASGGPHKH